MIHRSNTNIESPQIMSSGDFKSALPQVLEALRGALSSATRQALDDNRPYVERTLEKLYAASEVEFRSDAAVATRALFRNVVPLENETAVVWRTRHLLSRNWDTLLVVAETGEWLLNETVGTERIGPERRICLIVADESKSGDLTSRFGEQIQIKKLDWWDHNRHMTIFVKKETPTDSIYFARRMRSASVAPVYLDATDSRTVLELFIAYWKRADDRRPWITASETRDYGAFFDRIKAKSEDPA